MIWVCFFPVWREAGVTLLPTLHFADKKAKDVFLSGNVILPGGYLNWLVRWGGWREGTAGVSGGRVEWKSLSAQRPCPPCSPWDAQWTCWESTKSGQLPEQFWFCIVRRGRGRKPVPPRPYQDIHMLSLLRFFSFHFCLPLYLNGNAELGEVRMFQLWQIYCF